jgi:hypothetical protein
LTECPVCGAVTIGTPEVCDGCGTPLDRVTRSKGFVSRTLSLLLPGISHLWNGYLARGGFALFGSFLFLLWLGREIRYSVVDSTSWVRLGVWVMVWSVWSIGWYWDRLRTNTRRPSPGRIVSSILVLLILANVLMLVLVIRTLSSPVY